MSSTKKSKCRSKTLPRMSTSSGENLCRPARINDQQKMSMLAPSRGKLKNPRSKIGESRDIKKKVRILNPKIPS